MKHVRALWRCCIEATTKCFNFVGILKIYVKNTRAIYKGCEMHADIEGKGLLDEHISVGYAENEQDWIERLLIFT